MGCMHTESSEQAYFHWTLRIPWLQVVGVMVVRNWMHARLKIMLTLSRAPEVDCAQTFRFRNEQLPMRYSHQNHNVVQ